MVKKYKKKPVVIEAVQWTGENVDEILEFCKGNGKYKNESLWIFTLEGIYVASIGDFIIIKVSTASSTCVNPIYLSGHMERRMIERI